MNGKIVITEEEMYITGNIHNPKDFIFVPLDPTIYRQYAIHGIKKPVEIINEEGEIVLHKKCIVLENIMYEVVKRDDLTWIEKANTWAFYRQ